MSFVIISVIIIECCDVIMVKVSMKFVGLCRIMHASVVLDRKIIAWCCNNFEQVGDFILAHVH